MGYSKDNFQITATSSSVLVLKALLLAGIISSFTGLLGGLECYAQASDDQLAIRLKANTVRVKGLQTGFGFVTGVRDGDVYIVTARHVLFGEEDTPNRPASSSPQVFFYSDQGKAYTATILGTHEGDLAVLRLPGSSGFPVDSSLRGGVRQANTRHTCVVRGEKK